jgi:hypothetical protein
MQGGRSYFRGVTVGSQLARPSIDHEHRGPHGLGAEPVQEFLAGVTQSASRSVALSRDPVISAPAWAHVGGLDPDCPLAITGPRRWPRERQHRHRIAVILDFSFDNIAGFEPDLRRTERCPTVVTSSGSRVSFRKD